MVSPPVLPRSPVAPVVPVAPVAPLSPGDPVAPVDPVDPGAPVGPAGPGTGTVATGAGVTVVDFSVFSHAHSANAIMNAVEMIPSAIFLSITYFLSLEPLIADQVAYSLSNLTFGHVIYLAHCLPSLETGTTLTTPPKPS